MGEPRRDPEGTVTRSATFQVVNRLGLHARAAARLVETVGRFRSEVELIKDGQRCDARSIMSVLLLCGHRGARITVVARGPDAGAVLEALGALFASGFGEGAAQDDGDGERGAP